MNYSVYSFESIYIIHCILYSYCPKEQYTLKRLTTGSIQFVIKLFIKKGLNIR